MSLSFLRCVFPCSGLRYLRVFLTRRRVRLTVPLRPSFLPLSCARAASADRSLFLLDFIPSLLSFRLRSFFSSFFFFISSIHPFFLPFFPFTLPTAIKNVVRLCSVAPQSDHRHPKYSSYFILPNTFTFSLLPTDLHFTRDSFLRVAHTLVHSEHPSTFPSFTIIVLAGTTTSNNNNSAPSLLEHSFCLQKQHQTPLSHNEQKNSLMPSATPP